MNHEAGDSLAKGWRVYIIIFVLSIFLGYAYIFFLKVCARPAIWTAIIFTLLLLVAGACWCFVKAPTMGTNQIMTENFGQFATNMTYATGALCAIGAFLILCIVICHRNKIETAVIAVQMTTDVMACMPSLLLAPVIKAIVKFIVAMLMMFGFIYLLSVAKVTSVAGSAMARGFEYAQTDYYMMFFYLFMFFWLMSFFSALYQFALAYATADYYYAEDSLRGAGDSLP